MSAIIKIFSQDDSPPIKFALSELEDSLINANYIPQLVKSFTANNLQDGTVILLGSQRNAPWLREILNQLDIVLPELKKDGYTIQVLRKDNCTIIILVGYDERGTMYGGCDLAEQIYLNNTLELVEEKIEEPFLEVRIAPSELFFKARYTPAGEKGQTMSQEEIEAIMWVFDNNYWNEFFDMLARNRYNAVCFNLGAQLGTYSIFDYVMKNKKYPEACSLSDQELQNNIQQCKHIFSMARNRGLDIYLQRNFNISIGYDFAEAHGIFTPPLKRLELAKKNWGDSPLVKDYTKEAVKAVLTTYPEVQGLVTTAGETMPGYYPRPVDNPGTWEGRHEHISKEGGLEYNAQWVKDTWVAAIKEVGRETGRIVDFIFRAWWTLPEVAQKVIAADYPGQIFVSLKFNGERGISSPHPHYYHEEWVAQQPRDYDLIWELRDNPTLFRWGDPEFIRQAIKNMAGEYSKGAYLWVPRMGSSGYDRTHSPLYHDHVTWDYLFQKYWFRRMLLGRLSYNPNIPEETWKQHFTKRFGEGGEAVYTALVESSKIIPEVSAFHWCYMGDEWVSEINIGGGTPFEAKADYQETAGDYREWSFGGKDAYKRWHTVMEWIFNSTIDDNWLRIPEYVNHIALEKPIRDDQTTPIQVANKLEKYARTSIAMIEKASPHVNLNVEEFECTKLDILSRAYLGLYYSEKTRGATELMFFLRTGDTIHQENAIKHLEQASIWWNNLCASASPHYEQLVDERGWTDGKKGRWEHYKRDVERDTRIPKQLGFHKRPKW